MGNTRSSCPSPRPRATAARFALALLVLAAGWGPSAVRAEAEAPPREGDVQDFTKLSTGQAECRRTMAAIRTAVLRYQKEHPAGMAAPVKELVDLGYLPATPICPATRSDQYTVSVGAGAGNPDAIVVAVKCPGPHGVVDTDAEAMPSGTPTAGTQTAGKPRDAKADMDACVANMDTIRLAVLHDIDEEPTSTGISVTQLVSKGYLPEAPRCPTTGSNQYMIAIGTSRKGVTQVDIRCPGPHASLSRPRLGK